MFSEIIVGLTFGLVGLAILAWVVVVIFEMRDTTLGKFIFGIAAEIFSAAPDKAEVSRSILPVRFTIERILPVIFWLLILLPMFVFPIILIIFPLLGLPWSYLLPPMP